jgi:rhomboid family protein
MTPWVLRLIIANGAVFLLSNAFPRVEYLFALVPSMILTRPWTVVTYMFLHGGFAHIFFNMLALFFFGPQVEARLGGRDFLWLYFLSGAGGAVASFIFMPNVPVIGASAGVFGVMLAFAIYWPDAPIYIWAIFPIKAKWLVIIFVVLELFFGVTGAESGIAHFAHLGGFASGWLFLKWRDRRLQRRLAPSTPSTLDRVSGKLQREERSWRAMDRERLHELNRQEVNRILSKIDAHGVQSITEAEREFMNRMAS